MKIITEEYLSISRKLEEHHALFYMAWKMGVPQFDDAISTAAVRFDLASGDFIQFVFNEKYWQSLNEYERTFVICHECLHVILGHGRRTKDSDNPNKCNISLDVIVNHMLVDNFGFDRKLIRNSDELCWLDTVFEDKNVLPNQYFEYYYNLLGKTSKFKLVDDHSGLGDQDWSTVIEKLGDGLSEEEKAAVRGVVGKYCQPGDTAGNSWQYVKVGKVKKKKKWETVIKKWSSKYNRTNEKEVEQWARVHRRFFLLGNDLILPTEMEADDKYEHSKIKVWFFQDTSGSCSGYLERFFKAALSLPEDRFEVKLHCFDTRVYETTLESRKLYGFGGTSFHPIEEYIQRTKEPYPEAVFIITDGYGSVVKPMKPGKWHVFLTTSCRYCFPDNCNFYNLSDFE